MGQTKVMDLTSVFIIFFYFVSILCLGDASVSRERRSIESERERLRNLSPQDRPNCKPGATKPDIQVNTTGRLTELRALFKTQHSIKGYIIPSEDEHQDEFLPNYYKRRKYITGMSGSAGRAVVLGDKAALWTDGRYFLQAEAELDCNWILMKEGEVGVPNEIDWIIANLNSGDRFGANAWLLTSMEWEKYRDKLSRQGITMMSVAPDLVDLIWTSAKGRPEKPSTPINALPVEFAGKSWQRKIVDMQEAMAAANSNVMVISGLDETAWLFNMRAQDIDINPFFLSYAIINAEANTTTLYIVDKDRKLVAQPTDPATNVTMQTHLNTSPTGSCAGKTEMCVEVKEYRENTMLRDLQTALKDTDASKYVLLSYFCNYAIYSQAQRSRILQTNTPAALQKAQKNPTERHGMKEAHKRDAVAVIKFIAKLEKEVKEDKYWTEVSAAADLKKHREEQKYNRGVSFPSISAVGSNGAVIHYTPSNATDRQITTKDMYLLDSGGQYLDGTTDITRTFHFGTPTDFQKECYTRVLMGQVDLADFKFTTGNLGREVDAIARRPLWDVGLQYRHGTGHGIGAFMSVHEGPGRISLAHPRYIYNTFLDEWQFFSDEPGYYEDGQFGIRLENIFFVKKVTTKYKFPGTIFLGFETITLVPYEPHLIDKKLLSQRQVDWINAYHKQVQETIGPLVEDDDVASKWLSSRTQEISLKEPPPIGSSSCIRVTFSLILLACVTHIFLYLN